jgi:hypothetical protein
MNSFELQQKITEDRLARHPEYTGANWDSIVYKEAFKSLVGNDSPNIFITYFDQDGEVVLDELATSQLTSWIEEKGFEQDDND